MPVSCYGYFFLFTYVSHFAVDLLPADG